VGWGRCFTAVSWIESQEKRAGRATRGRSLSNSYAMGLDCGWLEARAESKPPKKFRPEDFEKFLNRQAQHAVSRWNLGLTTCTFSRTHSVIRCPPSGKAMRAARSLF
jgi:hypothetical protein